MISKKYFKELKSNNINRIIPNYKKKFFYSFSIQPYVSTKLIQKTVKKKLTNFQVNTFWNQSFDKNRLKIFVFWCFKNYGQNKTIKVLEVLKNLGFQYATKAGLSLSIDDLLIPKTKSKLLIEAELITRTAIMQYKNAQITNLERFQKIIETWHITSEKIKDDMIHYFKTTNIFNPLYMMAFSGARGNVSQVRQLVGMRGLMANPQGQILDFPILSNFREGLTLTEYVISCYGARKGVVDTALRTANAGYLTRRLVDVAQHIIISNFDCGTNRGLIVSEMKQGNKLLFSLRERLLGRVLAKDVLSGNLIIARKNQELSDSISEIIASFVNTVAIRSPLTCKTTQFICQRCYGWSLSEGKLVGVGETVGIIAAQSIGEPGTQLTMRTFHTGGVFAGELLNQLIAPFTAKVKYNIYIPGNLIRTPQGTIAFLTRVESQLILQNNLDVNNKKYYTIPPYTILFIRNGETVSQNQLIAQLCSFSPSFKNTSNNLSEYKIYSELEGEIKSTNLTLVKKITEKNDVIHRSLEWGYIWILSGKIYQLPFNSIDTLPLKSSFQQKKNFFPIKGDFLTKYSILSQISWINNIENLKFDFQEKTNFSNKFINNKKLLQYATFDQCNEIQWLTKWERFSKINNFKGLNKSIKKFNKKFDYLVQNSLINLEAQNLLFFLTIDKIRYKKLGYFIKFKKNSKQKSIKNLKIIKTNPLKNKENKTFLEYLNIELKNNNKDLVQQKNQKKQNKIFLSIPLEYNKNQKNSVTKTPQFFYQKESNRFFQLFFNESDYFYSGLINFSEILLFKNKKQFKKIKKKKQKTIINKLFVKKQNLNLKKTKKKPNNLLFCSSYKSYSIQQNTRFLYLFNNKKEINTLNSNYSITISFYSHFIQNYKQQLSQYSQQNVNNCYLSFIEKPLPIKSKSIIFIKETNFKQTSKNKNSKSFFAFQKQFLKNNLFQYKNKSNSNRYVRFNLHQKKENKRIKVIETQKVDRTKTLQISTKKFAFLEQIPKLNRLNKNQYKSLNPNSFLKNYHHKIKDLLLRKNFYNKLELSVDFDYQNKLINFHKKYNNIFMILTKNYIGINFFSSPNNYKKKYLTLDFPIFEKFSNIFIHLSPIDNKSKNKSFFCYENFLNKFSYINLKKIWKKQKFIIPKKHNFKINYEKSKETLNIKNLKKFYFSFTYYIIKNQFRFAPSFQEQSVNQLENIYKKEIKNLPNIHKHKLLLIKQLNKNCLFNFVKNEKISKNSNDKLNSTNLILLHSEYKTLFKKHDFIKLIKQIKKSQENSLNKKFNKDLIKPHLYLLFLFKQLVTFSNSMFNIKQQNQHFSFFDFKQKKFEKRKLNNYSLLHYLNFHKFIPMILIKYKKKKNINSFAFHKISVFQNFLTRNQIKGKKIPLKINGQNTFLTNQINNLILKTYILKLNSKKNILINYYFQLTSFKWLQIDSKFSLIKTRIFNPIFFKRLSFLKFINKNLILSNEYLNQSNQKYEFDRIQEKKIKQKKINKYSKNMVIKRSDETLLLYSRISLISEQYIKAANQQLSIIIFQPQQEIINDILKILLKTNFTFLFKFNILALFQKSLFSIKKNFIYNKKLQSKKPLKNLTLKNFLYLNKLKTDKNSSKKIVSKKNYLQKINTCIFNFFQIFYNKKFEIFKNNRQCELLPIPFQFSYGILKLEKTKEKSYTGNFCEKNQLKNKSFTSFSLFKNVTEKTSRAYLSFKNKTNILITQNPNWICKPIKRKHIEKNVSKNFSKTMIYYFYFVLKKKLKLFNLNYIHSFNSITINTKLCEKKLIWFNCTFLKMIELIEKFHKLSYNKSDLSYLPLSVLYSKFYLLKLNKTIKYLKNRIEKDRKSKNYFWLINKKARFINMTKFSSWVLKEDYLTKKRENSENTEKIFCIIKVKELVMNNYQNLSYFSDTNLMFLSKLKLYKLFRQKNQQNLWWNNNGLILKDQYNFILLNKQKISKKLISKFPNLEVTIEQYLKIPSDLLTKFSKNHFSNDLTKKRENMVKQSVHRNKLCGFSFLGNLNYMQLNNLDKIKKKLSLFNFKIFNKNKKIVKYEKPIKIFNIFVGFSIPINFEFSFQSSSFSWNFFPDYNISKLKYEKKIHSTEFLTYLILKNSILQKVELKIHRKEIYLQPSANLNIFINILSYLKILLHQPCINWSANHFLKIGYRKNIFVAPTKTFLLLSSSDYLKKNQTLATTKLYSGWKGEIVHALKNEKNRLNYSYKNELADFFLLNENFLKPDSSLFLTKSDQICLKFKKEKSINRDLDFIKKLNRFQTHKHIRSLKIFKIKSSKQIILVFKILQKIHNTCQFSNQSKQIKLGLLSFQGDLLNTCFLNNDIRLNYSKKTKKTTYIKSIGVNNSGQIIHLNQCKITLRKGQPIFFSPHCIFHSYNGDLIEQNQPVLSLPYQQLKTGDIVQGIPKIEQLFEARLTFAGKLEFDNLTNILEILFEMYKHKLELKLAVRRSTELIQMIIINSIQRIYRSQGVNISDKHLEVIIKQMTKKVEIIDSVQSGFLIGEHFDLDVVELWNSKLPKIKQVKYKPLILGISKASLETDSFLSAASFQYTTRILSQAAFFKKRDYLKGLKENIIVGNIIPAGTGYLGNIENLLKTK